MADGRFAGKTALVTGAGRGIGRATAQALAEAGATVALTARNRENLRIVQEHIRATGGRAEVFPADLAGVETVEALATAVLDAWQTLDILVHSAGVFRRGRIEETGVEDFDALVNTNFRGPFLLTRALLPALKQTRGRVVFVNSTAGLAAGAPHWGLYAATKAALKMLADSLRSEVNEHGIRVVSVYPGRTATDMQAEVYRLEAREYQPDRLLQPESVAESILQALAQPADAEWTDLTLRPHTPPSA